MDSFLSVSIILVTYNAEAFMCRAIDGLLAQTSFDYEILIIDDGSTDRTSIICDDFAKKEPRIRVFHEQHQGVAHARQVGIEHAQGEYTIHIDTDDTISKTMLEEMYREAKKTNADLLICDYEEQNKDGIVYHVQKPSALNKEAVVNDLIDGRLYGALWNKLIRTSVFRGNQIHFRQELKMREDLLFVFDVLPFVTKIAYLPKAFYTYDRTNNIFSLTNTYLREDRNYYDQEVLWCKAALSNPLVGDEQKNRLKGSLLNYAYITLIGNVYTKAEWLEAFAPCRHIFNLTARSYKRKLVEWALNNHYQSASAIRRMLALIGKMK